MGSKPQRNTAVCDSQETEGQFRESANGASSGNHMESQQRKGIRVKCGLDTV
jgi:hypothetical protein